MNHTTYEPKLPTFMSDSLLAAFGAWMVNGGYKGQYDEHKVRLTYTCQNKESVAINLRTGELNAAGQKRYALFLKMYFKSGKDMVQKLKFQAQTMAKERICLLRIAA